MKHDQKSRNTKIYIALLFPFLVLAVLLYSQWKSNVSTKQNYSDPVRIFSEKYPEGYKTESIPLNGKQTVLIEVVNQYNDSPPTKAPLLWIQGTDKIYQISFTDENGDSGISNNKFFTTDLDQNGNQELVTEWNLNWGGSGGFKGLVIWKYENGSIIPLTGYPEDFESDRKVQVKNLDGKVIAEYPVTNLNYMTRVNPGGKFYFGSFIYDIQNESHTGPHYWKLSAYKYQQDEFVRDESWNNGEEITTNEKYALSEDPTLFMDLYPYFKQ